MAFLVFCLLAVAGAQARALAKYDKQDKKDKDKKDSPSPSTSSGNSNSNGNGNGNSGNGVGNGGPNDASKGNDKKSPSGTQQSAGLPSPNHDAKSGKSVDSDDTNDSDDGDAKTGKTGKTNESDDDDAKTGKTGKTNDSDDDDAKTAKTGNSDDTDDFDDDGKSEKSGKTGKDDASNPCDPDDPWNFITCFEGQVIALDTEYTALGTDVPVPSLLGLLQKLMRIQLHSAGLSGPLPDAWSGLSSLIIVGLSNNTITGSIPAIWKSPSPLANDNSLFDLRFNADMCGPLPDGWAIFKAATTGTQIGTDCPEPPPPPPPPPPPLTTDAPPAQSPGDEVAGNITTLTDIGVGDLNSGQLVSLGYNLTAIEQPAVGLNSKCYFAGALPNAAVISVSDTTVCFDTGMKGVRLLNPASTWPLTSAFYEGMTGLSTAFQPVNELATQLVITLPPNATAFSFYASGYGYPVGPPAYVWSLTAVAVTDEGGNVTVTQLDDSPLQRFSTPQTEKVYFGKWYGFAASRGRLLTTVTLAWTNPNDAASPKGFLIGDLRWPSG
ncbi:hypothetical protein FOA52_014414 [Chlamydomonas sp. UWO 241]|nr:hypothetical protein FOA52_014414 [Chlamydomonas sp. UWO 241]